MINRLLPAAQTDIILLNALLKTFIVGTCWNCHVEVVVSSTHNYCIPQLTQMLRYKRGVKEGFNFTDMLS